MRITNLPASSNFAANDVLAIEIDGVTYKLTGATLAEAIKSIGDYVTTSDVATTTADGLMTSSDKVKLNGIASGAQVNSITGVKGNAESSYRTGNVNLTPANIGALSLSGGTMTGSINFSDSSAHNVGGVSYVHDTNGTDRTYVIARTLDGSSNIQLGVKRNGDNSLSYHLTNPAQFRQDAGITPANIGIKAGTRVSQFAAGSASFAPSDIGLTAKPNCLILTLSSNAATNPPTYDTFLSYDWDDSTDSTIVIKGYKANGTAAAGYIRYSYIAIQ